MSLPAIARRIDLAVLRPAEGVVDEWNRPDRSVEVLVATFRGDLQPDRNLSGAVEGDSSREAAPAPVRFTVYADPGVELRAGDYVRRDPDDGLRYAVDGPGRLIGEGTHLAHVIATVSTVRRP